LIKVHHIGYLVKNIDKARKSFEVLGFKAQGDTVFDSIRGVDIIFLDKDGYVVELVSPVVENSVVAELIKKYKNSPYHMCYVSDNFEEDLKSLEAQKFTCFDEPKPAPALGGRKVCFLMNPRIGMIELLEA